MHKSNDTATYAKIVEDINPQEIEFMKMFEIDDGDGMIDKNEFIILTVIRIGATPPELIHSINERFKELDRNHTGLLQYDDVVFGRKKRRQSLLRRASRVLLSPVKSWRGSEGTASVSPLPAAYDTDIDCNLPEFNKWGNNSSNRPRKSVIDEINTSASRPEDKSVQRFLSRLTVSRSHREISPSIDLEKESLPEEESNVSISKSAALQLLSGLESKAPANLCPNPVKCTATKLLGQEDSVRSIITKEVEDSPTAAEVHHGEADSTSLLIEEIDEVADLEVSPRTMPVLFDPKSSGFSFSGTCSNRSSDEIRRAVRPLSIDVDDANSTSGRKDAMPVTSGLIETPSRAIVRRLTRSFKAATSKGNTLLSAKQRKEELNAAFTSKRNAITVMLRIYMLNPYVQAIFGWYLPCRSIGCALIIYPTF